jgi:hypothetical protein
MTKKPGKAFEDLVFLSQYERYLRGKISYRELHNLDDDGHGAREKPAGSSTADATKTRRRMPVG